MMDWKSFLGRRRLTLQDFIKNCKTEQEALALFENKKLTTPNVEEIRRILSSKIKPFPMVEPVKVQSESYTANEVQEIEKTTSAQISQAKKIKNAVSGSTN